MREYARQRGLRRLIIPVPVLTPRLSSLWLGLVTPLYARVGRKLIDSIRHPTVVQDDLAARAFGIAAVGHREAIRAALRNEDREFAESRWCDALSAGGTTAALAASAGPTRLVDAREAAVGCSPARVFAAVERIGGQTGWYSTNWLWGLRGAVDLLMGGIGMRRGRPHPERLRVGDTLDCWRVESLEPGRRLLLAAEMRLPGRAWLEFVVTPSGQFTRLHQTAMFDPQGLLGRAYWYLIYPLHQLVFAGMLRGIAQASSTTSSGRERHTPGIPLQILAMLLFLLLCFGTAAVGARWTSASVDGWYQTLTKPAWSPPDWVFGPVWTVLYLLMAVAGWLVWRRRGIVAARWALLLFAAQLALNALWSGIFFAWQSPGWAFAEILILWSAIAGTVAAFWPHSRWGSYLLAPYLAWSSFAAVLNLAIWRLNA
jgi:tryptophan-rich sensory protein